MDHAPAPRLRKPNRAQTLPWLTLDEMLPDDHPGRVVWAYVLELDLEPFVAAIRAVEGVAGRDATDPRLLLAVWMLATIEGVGSARWLNRLCTHHLAYLWLCGGVTLNYHTLSDFRSNHSEKIEAILTDHIAALMHMGLVGLQRVAQDGLRVRADAGSGSFHRPQTLDECQTHVAEQLARLKDQPDEAPGSAARRSRAAKERHAQEKADRVKEAQKVAADLDAKRRERLREHPKEAVEAQKAPEKKAGRGSTTDPHARQMKMPDGGYRPGYNVQAATTTEEGLIVAVDVTNQGTDAGLMGPMIDQMKQSYGRVPKEMLEDGGFMSVEDVEKAAELGIDVYMPLRDEKKVLAAGKDPYSPKKGDKAGMRALRGRMGTEAAKTIYTQRAATAEWVNAGMRNRGLYQFLVRGLTKVKAVVLMQALAHNLFATIRLCHKKKLVPNWTEILRTGFAGMRHQGRMAIGGG